MGRKRHAKEDLRSFYSFLLASGLHLLLFLFNGGAQWGVEAGQTRIIPVYSRLVVVEEKPVLTQAQTPATVKKDPPPAKKEVPPKKEAKAEVAAVVQEQPAPRQAPPVEKEERPSPGAVPEELPEAPVPEETVPGTDQETVSEEEGPEAAPPLPPLGSGRGMVAAYPMTYQKNLQHERVEGRIRLEVFLAADGKPLSEPVILQSSGDQRLDEHCLKTITRYWQFTPAAAPYKITVEVTFSQQAEPPVTVEFIGDATYFSPEGGDS